MAKKSKGKGKFGFININVEETNKELAEKRAINLDNFKSYNDPEYLEHCKHRKNLINDVLVKDNFYTDLDKIHMFEDVQVELFKKVHTYGIHSLYVRYVFDRMHKESPELSLSYDEFLAIYYHLSINEAALKEMFDKASGLVNEIIIEAMNKQAEKKKNESK